MDPFHFDLDLDPGSVSADPFSEITDPSLDPTYKIVLRFSPIKSVVFNVIFFLLFKILLFMCIKLKVISIERIVIPVDLCVNFPPFIYPVL